MQAIWKATVVAESSAARRVDGYWYFPIDGVRRAHLRPSAHTSVCGWKGTARSFDVVLGEDVAENAAWQYERPKPAAEEIAGHIAFWRGVVVEP